MKLALACLFATATAAAEPSDATAKVEKLADGVYAIIHEPATDYWSHSNSGVVIGSDSVLVIDATYLPSRARADIKLIHQLTTKPVRYLAFTHWHDDHTNGAVAYRDAFPGIAIIAEEEMARFIELTGPAHQHEALRPGSDERKRIAELEAIKQPTAAQKLALAQRKGELAELAAFVMVPPTLRFTQRMTLDLGHRVVELKNWGHANSPDDVTFYLPAERVLFTGDIVVQDPFPYYSQSWPVPWIAVLKQLELISITSLVPGHGPVFHDHHYTSLMRELMEQVATRVEQLTREGDSVTEMQAAIDGEDMRAKWPAWSGGDKVLWKRGIDRLIERAWRGIRGQGG